MDPTQATMTRPLGLADVLGAVKTWPPEDVLALTRELVDVLPPEEREALARQALAKTSQTVGAVPPPKRNFAELIGMIPYDGPPITDEDLDRLREERLWEKYGPW